MILKRRVASVGVNRSWMVRGAIEFPSVTVLVFSRNWTWIAVCQRIQWHGQKSARSISLCELIMQQNPHTIIIQDVNSGWISARYKWGWCCCITRNNKPLCSLHKDIICNVNYKALNIVITCSLTQCQSLKTRQKSSFSASSHYKIYI